MKDDFAIRSPSALDASSENQTRKLSSERQVLSEVENKLKISL